MHEAGIRTSGRKIRQKRCHKEHHDPDTQYNLNQSVPTAFAVSFSRERVYKKVVAPRSKHDDDQCQLHQQGLTYVVWTSTATDPMAYHHGRTRSPNRWILSPSSCLDVLQKSVNASKPPIHREAPHMWITSNATDIAG